MKKVFLCLIAALTGATMLSAFADGESLAETGGYVTTSAQLAFKDISVADLGTAYVPSAKMSGGWVTADGMPVSFGVRTTVDGAVRYQAQVIEGNVKAVAIEFTDGEGGVYARAYVDQGFYNSDLTKFGSDIYIASSQFAGAIATSADDGTYGIHNLGLVSVDDLDAICLNFNDSNETMVKTYDPVGPTGYAVTGFMWSQMLGTNNNTMNGVRLIDAETSATLDLPAVTVTITGTRGTWSYGGYTGASDVRYGYIDENWNNPTPTVTITNIPFDYYKVVFIPSTDSSNSKFGYITVNSKNYSSDNTELASDKDYDLAVDSTDAWGLTKVADYLHGVNYLVTPVLVSNNARTLTVSGHASNGRGCIAAIQIVKAEAPDTLYDVTATGDVTWSTKTGLAVNSGTWASGKTIRLVNNQANPVTVTFDEAVNSEELILSGSGTTIIKFDDAAYNQITTFNFADVSGEVVLDDYMQTVSFIPPSAGALRYQGAATLTSVPCASGAVQYAVIVDQPLTVGEFALEGVKSDYRFGENFVGSFASRFILGNGTGANQNVTQLGGSITVSGSVDETNTNQYNQVSVLLGHYGSLTSRLNTYGGTFNVPNSGVRLGHDGACVWTIGDGESANDGTAVVNVKGILNTTYGHPGTGSNVALQQGGTLNLGVSSINIPYATFTLAGGKLATAAESAISVSAGTLTSTIGTDTEISTANGLTIASSIGGAGSVTKTGAGMLTLSASATSTGTLTVNEGTLELPAGVTWAGTIALGANGTLNIVDATIDAASTVYIPVGGALTVGSGTVTVNGAAIDTDIWELSGGTFVNKTLKTAVTTAAGDFAFTTATWESALGAGAEIDWAGSLSEVRVHANNASPATATVDVTAANVATFAVDGSGDMTFVADNGGITASAYDFSEATGRVEYDLSTGNAPVTSGSNTLLLGGGSGTPTVAAGRTLTLGPWGNTSDNITYTLVGLSDEYFRPATGATLVLAPGEDKVQTSRGFGNVSVNTTIAISNGTYHVTSGGGSSGHFGSDKIRVDNGGILKLEIGDSTGYNQTSTLTIEKGGLVNMVMRDSLRRNVVFNGGTLRFSGEQGNSEADGCGIHLLNGPTITVNEDSVIEGVDGGAAYDSGWNVIEGKTVTNPRLAFRGSAPTFNVAAGKKLVNRYQASANYQAGLTKTGAGMMQMNGVEGA